MTVVAFQGAGGIGAANTNAGSTGAPSVSVVTSRAGSLVYAVGNDWDSATPRAVGGGQTLVHQWADAATGDTFWVQASSVIGGSGTTVVLSDTAPTTDRWNLAAVEIIGQ